MQEYVTDAIVLDKEPNGDLDVRYSLFTKHYGKLKVKAKSARKITSKLAGHLEPGYVTRVRLVEKNGLQVTDALKAGNTGIPPARLYLLHTLLAEAEPERELWQALAAGSFRWPEILKILGWDPAHALCERCGRSHPEFFVAEEHVFVCGSCARNGASQRVPSVFLGAEKL